MQNIFKVENLWNKMIKTFLLITKENLYDENRRWKSGSCKISEYALYLICAHIQKPKTLIKLQIP